MKKSYTLILIIILLSLVAVMPVAAQDPDRPTPPVLPLPPIAPPEWNFQGLEIEYQRVDVMIKDQVATTHIDQLFVNNNDWMLEGTYLFPLPDGAAVSQLTMWIDGEPIEAKILEAPQARKIYDEIVRQLRDPALLEYIGTSAIQANVFPIPPHDERRIEIEYSQVLLTDNGLIHYVYPQSSDLYTNTPLDNQSIRVEVQSDEAIRTIYSPSHPVAVDRDGEFRAIVGYEDDDVKPEEDFELYYSIAPEDIGLNLLTYKEENQDGFFLLLLAPKVETDLDQVVSKDVILVLDVSGSMAGEKMTQAKDAALFVADNLNPGDRFNIVAFSTGVRSFSSSLAVAGDAGNYSQFINSLEALGGTNISGALLEAVTQADDERPTTLIFLTDGLATEGIVDTAMLLDSIASQTPDNVRIFAFGVGDDVDTFLLDSLAQNHNGATTYVRPGQDIDEAVSAFYSKVSTPVLANISLDFGDVVVEQVYPDTLPDLFAGTQLVLTGRYREGGPATITLNGELNGHDQQYQFEDNTFRMGGGDDFIPRLWATRAIGHLLTQVRLHGEDPELIQSIVELSTRYGIITPFTSYLIEEDDIFSQTGRNIIIEEMEQELAAPAEVSGEAAVDRAAAQAEMAAAEAPLPMPTATILEGDGTSRTIGEVVKSIGSKTFLWRDGIWIDTAYEVDTMMPEQVGFASDAYFDLLSTAPEIGRYLAIGPRVLLVYENHAYEIVEGEGQAEITLPGTSIPIDSTIEAAPSPGNQITSSGNDSATTEPDDVVSTPGNNDTSTTNSQSGLCGASLLAPLAILGAVVFSFKARKKSQKS